MPHGWTRMPIDYDVAYGVVRVTLNRPEKRNALNPDMIRGLREALDRAAADESARVVLLRGAGQDFCAGLDLTGLAAEASAMDHLADAHRIADLFVAMRRNPRSTDGAVFGPAL